MSGPGLVPYGEYWSKTQAQEGKARAKRQGYTKFKITQGTFIQSWTLYVKPITESEVVNNA